jgi:glyoxylase-like metal-dependent hydrolase (beta-lactamase superfamily II)/rhodanese-related sulfurtransferase
MCSSSDGASSGSSHLVTSDSIDATIEVDELRAMLAKRQLVTVLDIRKAEDRAEWAIPGSMHVDAYEALKAGDPAALEDAPVPMDAPVVTVCGAGKASFTAMEQLRARGYDARSLVGGMKAWSLAWNSAEVSVPGSAATVIQVRRTGKGCLSYLIGNGDEAAVIDAALPPTIYQEFAAERGWVISHVLETHVHADHLSRARLLAEETGATLHLPEQERVSYPFSPMRDGETVEVGSARITALHTPGHTLESTCYLLDGKALCSGDTLFLAGVGRPDLEASAEQARERARLLHASLARLTALPPEIVILPGHTSEPAPFDDRPISATLAEVIGRVGMLGLPAEAFLEAILARIPPTPPNHAQIVALNEAGAMPEGDPTDLEAGANRCAVS